MINFVTLGPSSLRFFIYCFTKTTSRVETHGVKQDVLLAIAEISEARGAEIAFPTSTVHLPEPVAFADEGAPMATQQARR